MPMNRYVRCKRKKEVSGRKPCKYGLNYIVCFLSRKIKGWYSYESMKVIIAIARKR